jgi:hypothetical protein
MMLRSALSPDGLSAIYSDHVNLAEWRRDLPLPVLKYAYDLAHQFPGYTLQQQLPAAVDETLLLEHLPVADKEHDGHRLNFARDLCVLCDMYACLFDLEVIGLRLSVLNKAMCPRFHVDQIVCRMICTYLGEGTEWLPEHAVNRHALGHAHNSETTVQAHRETETQQLAHGSVALLKGEKWPGNAGRGIVHRSPAVASGQTRLVVTLDPVA